MDPQVSQWFASVDADRSGRINAVELQSALMSSNGRKFSETACRLMIGMFDPQAIGSIDMHGFAQLYGYVNQWITAFRNYDGNQSGYIDGNEFGQALSTMGYRFSPQFGNVVASKFGEKNQGLPLDQFITACILIHKFTEGFRARDTSQQGVISISYEDFLSMVLSSWA